MPKIKNLQKAGKRILKAIKQKEPIIIYGDSDMDGVSSVVILKEAIATAGAQNYTVYFPDREIEGYGINKKALSSLKSPALLVVLDCGIGNIKEVELANKMGFEVIIIDHHEPLDKVPQASIIVDPKQKGDTYPFKDLANAGLTFKLAESILKEMPDSLRRSFLELVAMATIADMMRREDENEEMITEGMGYLENTWRPGIKALFNLPDLKDLTLFEKITKINSLLNTRNTKDKYPASYLALTEPDQKEAEKLAYLLLQRGIEKKKRIKEIVKEVESKILTQEAPIIFEGDESWELVLVGVAAAIISKNYKKPVFLYKRYDKDSQGSVRAPDGFNTVEAMKTCDSLLVTYGGHPRASGFRVKNKDLDKFKKSLITYFQES